MIARYSRPAMAALWTDEAKFARWLDVELAVMEAQEASGLVPAGTTATVRAKARFDVARIDALEATLHHDVIAFLTNVSESLGEEKRFVHQGMTSSDLVDTALALQMKDAGRLLLDGVTRVEKALATLAAAHKTTLMVGRTHGVHAEPMTFGLKALSWATAVRRSPASRWASSRAQSASPRTSLPRSKSAASRRSACAPSRSPPRSWRATATPRC